MMPTGYLVLFLLAISAARAVAEEPAGQLRAAKVFDSFESEMGLSDEEPNKRSLYSWLTKTPTDFDKAIIEEDILEVEVPVKEEMILKVPVAPVEVPLPERPYSVELRLSVPESAKSPIKLQVPFPEVYRPTFQVEAVPSLELPPFHYPIAKKPEFWSYGSLPEIYPSYSHYFTHPIKTEVIEPSPVVTEFAAFKSPLIEERIVEEDILVPEVYPHGKLGYPYKNFFPKPNPSKVVVEESLSFVPFEEERIIKTQPSPFYYPKPLHSLVEEPIASFDWINTPYEKERIFKTQPSSFYYSQPLPSVIEESVLVGNPFPKHYTGKSRFGSFGSKYYK